MTAERFSKCLQELDKKMLKSERKICLLIDNCPAHPADTPLHNIELVFLPPNSTSLLQPLGQGIIKVVKTCCRRRLVQRFLRNMENPDTTKPANLLDAILNFHASWDAIQPATIANCFKKAGFNKLPDLEHDAINIPVNDDWGVVQQQLGQELDFDEYVEIDANMVICEIRELNEIISDATEDKTLNVEADSGEEEEGQTDPLPTRLQAMAALDLVCHYVIAGNVTATDNIISHLNFVENALLNNSSYMRQLTIDSFLKRA